MAFTQFIGRSIVALFLLVSAYVHLSTPKIFLAFYEKSYLIAHGIATQQGASFLPLPEELASKWILIIKIVGVYELISAILIIHGDKFGSIMAFLHKVVAYVFVHYALFEKGINFASEHSLDLAKVPIILGIIIAIMARNDQESSPVVVEQTKAEAPKPQVSTTTTTNKNVPKKSKK